MRCRCIDSRGAYGLVCMLAPSRMARHFAPHDLSCRALSSVGVSNQPKSHPTYFVPVASDCHHLEEWKASHLERQCIPPSAWLNHICQTFHLPLTARLKRLRATNAMIKHAYPQVILFKPVVFETFGALITVAALPFWTWLHARACVGQTQQGVGQNISFTAAVYLSSALERCCFKSAFLKCPKAFLDWWSVLARF